MNPTPIDNSTVVSVLYNLPSEYYWVYANEMLFRAVSKGEPLALGIRGRLLLLAIKLSKWLKIHWAVIFLFGLFKMTSYLLDQSLCNYPKESNKGENRYNKFFIGFGAGREEYLFKQYLDANKPDYVERFNQIDLHTFSRYHHVQFFSGVSTLISSIKIATLAVDKTPELFINYRDYFFLNIIKRIAYYSYLYAWFKFYADTNYLLPKEVAFTSPDVAAFAAIDSGLPTCYLQHGMIRRSILFPPFDRIIAHTSDEAFFMQQRLPKTQIIHSPRVIHNITKHLTKTILVTSIHGVQRLVSEISPLLKWAVKKNLSIMVRLHPSENGEFWKHPEIVEHIQIQSENISFTGALDKLHPRFVISWFSTTLLDALEHGVIPISICATDDQNVSDMVYPLFQHCLRWPEDTKLIERLLRDDEYYTFILSRLQEGTIWKT